MKIPKYVYPKYYSYQLVKDNNQYPEAKDIKLTKNLKISKEFKQTEERHLKHVLENTKIWEEKYQNLSKEDYKQEDDYTLFDFIYPFRVNKFMSKKYNLGIYFTNAFRKMYEICELTPFIDTKLKKIRHFDICGLPGGFVFGINHFLKTRNPPIEYDWYLQSYRKKEKGTSYFTDEYGLVKKNRNRILMGDGTGDITKIKNIEEYYHIFEGENGCDIVTSDCGLGFEAVWNSGKDDYGREKQMAKTFYAQLICGLGVLKKGGNFFMKTYHSFSPFFVSLIYLLGMYFEDVRFVKPEGSRQPGGKEVYLLCLGLKDIVSKEEKVKLLGILKNFKDDDLSKNIISYSEMNKDIVKDIEDGLASYYLEKIEIREKVTKFKLDLVGVSIFDNPEEYFLRKELLYESSQQIMLRYYKDYFVRYKYKRIEKKDMLV